MIKKIKDKRDSNFNDSGFSEKGNLQGSRLLNKDGSFRSKKVGLSFFDRFSLFHTLHELSWMKFMIYVFLFYFIVNMLFAALYMWIGVDGIGGAIYFTRFEEYMQAFYFSCQTITTVGFGSLNPSTNAMQVVSSLESFIGLMLFAIMTGILYGRFSKPRAQFIFSEGVVIAPYRKGKGLMFRLANAKNTDMIDVEIEVLIGYMSNGKRVFEKLELERDKINFLPTSWTVVHPLGESSPLHGWTKAEFNRSNLEVVVAIKAFDNTFDQWVNSRTSYKYSDVAWNQKFVPIISVNESGDSIVDLSLIGDYEPVTL